MRRSSSILGVSLVCLGAATAWACGVSSTGTGTEVGAVGPAAADVSAFPNSPTCVLPDAPPNTAKATRIAPTLTFEQPSGLLVGPGGRHYVQQRQGYIKTFVGDDATSTTTMLDISDRIKTNGFEDGLLGFALHPRFTQTGEVFFSYTTIENGDFLWVVDRAQSDGKVVDPKTIEHVLTIKDYRHHHNGGHMAFGPDGMLYVSAGEGDDGDPEKRPQNLGDLHGKMLRLDVDSQRPYAVPKDNPFVATPGARGEIWAYGLRNPWSFNFDSKDGALWVGDVGQYAVEEIDVIQKGGNYGWSVVEGTVCFSASSCDTTGMIPPVFEYLHPEGLAVMGGTVYRGSKIPGLYGSYVFADWSSGWFRALDKQADGTYAARFLTNGPMTVGFGEDPDTHELSMIDWDKGGVYKLDPNDAPSPAKTLRATGCADPADITKAAPGFFAYDVNMPLWSDGADKKRFFSLPPGSQISVGDNGFMDLPPGSVAYKSFALAGKPVEVRLLVHHKNGEWGGYSYVVRDDGSDADLTLETVDKKFGDQTWTYPGRTQCFACHNNAFHRTLGLETAQLNRGTPNQIDVLAQLQAFAYDMPPASKLPRLPTREAPDGNEWVRAYLHANCSVCHRPDGPELSRMDMHYWTPLKDMSICNPPVAGTFGITGNVFTPEDPDDSVLMARISRRGAGQMPPLGTHVIDTYATKRIQSWIERTHTCDD